MTEHIDSKDHIRIHLTAKTELGRQLSEFYCRPFRDPVYNEFKHLIGFSLYLKTGCKESKFRTMNPFVCIERAKGIPGVWLPEFETIYRTGIRNSISSDETLVKRLLDSDLPFMVYNKVPGDLDIHPDRLIIADEVTSYRKFLRENRNK